MLLETRDCVGGGHNQKCVNNPCITEARCPKCYVFRDHQQGCNPDLSRFRLLILTININNERQFVFSLLCSSRTILPSLR